MLAFLIAFYFYIIYNKFGDPLNPGPEKLRHCVSNILSLNVFLGGKIVSIRNTEEHDHGGATLSLFGIPLCSTGNGARAVIQVIHV